MQARREKLDGRLQCPLDMIVPADFQGGEATMIARLARFGILLLIPLATTPAPAAPKPLTPEALAPQVQEAEQTGAAIYRHDHAASVATDVLDTIDFRRDNRLTGWITEEEGDSTVVTFVGGEGRKTQFALYRVVVSDDGTADSPQEFKPGLPLSADQLAQAAARALAAKQRLEMTCTPQFNTVVLPRGSGDKRTWVVYMLPGTTDPDVLPMGGAYRIETNRQGSRVLSKRAFSKACIPMPTGPEGESMIVTHLLDPHPTEIHVFLSLLSSKAIFVATIGNRLMWVVKTGAVTFGKSLDDEE